ncbi:hypothetical protein B0H14DRAFT_3145901 [Mycena olivaceomarginata]|nr:hypothetical protein B0H14DRAFT_3145901 [Mycena olivaceomarginata]
MKPTGCSSTFPARAWTFVFLMPPTSILSPLLKSTPSTSTTASGPLSTAESLLSTAASVSTTTSSPSNIVAEGEGNVDDGRASDNNNKGNTVQAKARCMKAPPSRTLTSPLIDLPPLRWMGLISVQDNNNKKMVASLGTGISLSAGTWTASKKSNAVRVKENMPEVTPELVCTPALPSIGSPPLVQGVNHFLLYIPNQWWMGLTLGLDSDNMMEVASIGMGTSSTTDVGAASKTNEVGGNE